MSTAESLLTTHPALIVLQRDIALSADGEKLRALQDAALRLAPLVANGEILKPDAVDALCDAAASNGLYQQCRPDDVEHVVGMGLSGVATLSPASNGKTWLARGAVKGQSARDGFGSSARAQPSGRALIACRAADIAPEKIDWLWQGRIARGAHTTIAGDPGTGKSQILVSMIAVVTRGGAWPCNEGGTQIGKVIMLCAEDSASRTVVPRLIAAGADLQHVTIIEGTTDEKGNRTFSLQADIDLLEQKIKEIGDVHLVAIDPVSSYMGAVDSHKNAEVRRVLAPVGEMAERTSVAVITVTHFSKAGAGASTKALYRFIGSIAFTAAPRAAFVVMEDPEDKNRRLFLHGKNNLAKPPQGLAFRLAQGMVGQNRDILASSVVWEHQPVSVTADEALGVGGNGEPTAQDDAADLLGKVLAAGPLAVKEVERQAVEASLLGEGKPIGQSKPFRTARAALGIITEKAGMHEGWTWALPKMPSETEDAL